MNQLELLVSRCKVLSQTLQDATNMPPQLRLELSILNQEVIAASDLDPTTVDWFDLTERMKEFVTRMDLLKN